MLSENIENTESYLFLMRKNSEGEFMYAQKSGRGYANMIWRPFHPKFSYGFPLNERRRARYQAQKWNAELELVEMAFNPLRRVN